MLSTSICLDSGGCVPILNSGPSFSPGSLRPSWSERSAPVTPPSTASGPCSFHRPCVCTGKTFTPWRLIGIDVADVGEQVDLLLDVPVARGEVRDRGDAAHEVVAVRERRRGRRRDGTSRRGRRRSGTRSSRPWPSLSPRMTAILKRPSCRRPGSRRRRRIGRPRPTGPRGSRRRASSMPSSRIDLPAALRVRARGVGEADQALVVALQRDEADRVGLRSLPTCPRKASGSAVASVITRSVTAVDVSAIEDVDGADPVHGHADLVAALEALVGEAPEVAAVGARQREPVGADGEVAEEQPRRPPCRRSPGSSRPASRRRRSRRRRPCRRSGSPRRPARSAAS